jgi:hypothetical protein
MIVRELAMKLSQYARSMGVHYTTALRWYHQGEILGARQVGGTIIVPEEALVPGRVIVWVGVPDAEIRLVDDKKKLLDGYKAITMAVMSKYYGRQRGRKVAEDIIKKLG